MSLLAFPGHLAKNSPVTRKRWATEGQGYTAKAKLARY